MSLKCHVEQTISCRTDHFIKVGITIRSVKVRFQRTHTSNYQIKHTSIYEVSLPLYEAYQLEQHILKTMEPHKYFPNYIFDGKTECLKATEHAIAQVLSIIEQKVKQ